MCAEASAEPGGERQRDRHGVEKAAGKFHVIGGRGGRNGVSDADAARNQPVPVREEATLSQHRRPGGKGRGDGSVGKSTSSNAVTSTPWGLSLPHRAVEQSMRMC